MVAGGGHDTDANTSAVRREFSMDCVRRCRPDEGVKCGWRRRSRRSAGVSLTGACPHMNTASCSSEESQIHRPETAFSTRKRQESDDCDRAHALRAHAYRNPHHAVSNTTVHNPDRSYPHPTQAQRRSRHIREVVFGALRSIAVLWPSRILET